MPSASRARSPRASTSLQARRRARAKVQLEMGGKNPLVVLDDADLGPAVDCAVQGAYFSTGQRCTASSRLIVRGASTSFVGALRQRIAEAQGRPRAGARHRDRARGRAAPARPEPDYLAIAQRRGRGHCAGRRAAEACDRRLLHGAGAVHWRRPTHAHRRARRSSGRLLACCAPTTTSRRWRSPTTRPSACRAGICTTLAQARDALQAPCPGRHGDGQPADRGRRLPRALRRAQGSSYGPREQGRYAAEFYTTVKTAYVLA